MIFLILIPPHFTHAKMDCSFFSFHLLCHSGLSGIVLMSLINDLTVVKPPARLGRIERQKQRLSRLEKKEKIKPEKIKKIKKKKVKYKPKQKEIISIKLPILPKIYPNPTRPVNYPNEDSSRNIKNTFLKKHDYRWKKESIYTVKQDSYSIRQIPY